MTIPDHPSVKNALLYGYPDGPRKEVDTTCPICRKQAKTFWLNNDEIFGCNICALVDEVDAEEYIYERMEG